MKKYHPDVNSDVDAQEFSSLLNEAYSVLSDDRKRKLYDIELQTEKYSETSNFSEKNTDPEQEGYEEDIQTIKCDRCGCQNSSLRISLMYYVVSLIYFTQKKGTYGIWCDRCRSLEALKWSTVSALFGWWGFPYGPIYTVQALFNNTMGGEQPKKNNAELLRILGYNLYVKGKVACAKTALYQSLKFEKHETTQNFYDSLDDNSETKKREFSLWKLVGAFPVLILCFIISIFTYTEINRPTGYKANYTRPNQATNTKYYQNKKTIHHNQSHKTVNKLIDQLAKIMEERSPIVGKHYEGKILIREHELDRLKFDSKEILPIANQIEKILVKEPLNSDGFVASSFFNAELFGISIDIYSCIYHGKPIDNHFKKIVNLGKSPKVNAWLKKSTYNEHYENLIAEIYLKNINYSPGTGISLNSYKFLFSELEQKIFQIDKELQSLESRGQIAEYNSMVPDYNLLIKKGENLHDLYRIQQKALDGLDSYFNKCLDINILLTRFNQVDLEHGKKVDKNNFTSAEKNTQI